MQNQDQLQDLDPLLDLDADAPPEFKCPITMSIMKEPIIMPDGQTYERKAIEEALKVNPISPVTRQPMSISEGKVNYALKSLIDKYIQEHKHEIIDSPNQIDPTQLLHSSTADSEIPVIKISSLSLETFTALHDENSMLITIKPLTIPGRLPVSIIALIDTSGSMQSDASFPAPGTENACFSRMQLVQYSLKTIISILGPSDQITLITFNDKAHPILQSVHLDQPGKKQAMKVIDKIEANGRTNVWDALDKGIDHAVIENVRFGDDSQLNTSILLFTDGEPNINPPMGIVPTLKEKLDGLKCHFSISSFGFGYQIDSELLFEIAELGNGVYGYCPDVTMVGTIFINYISSLISMVAPIAVLKVNQDEYNVPLYNDSPTNFFIKTNKKNLQINLSLPLTNQVFLINEIKKLDDDQNDLNLFNDQRYRRALIDLILNSKVNKNDSQTSIENCLKLFDQLKGEKVRSQFMNNIMIDLYNDDDKHGQIERAYRKEYFNKWGKNYLFSFLRFHILEQCGNFKDLSLQLYGNDVFKKVRKIGNKIFMNLPIPVMKQQQQQHHHHHHHRQSHRSSINFNQTMSSPRLEQIIRGRNQNQQQSNNSPRPALSRRHTMRSFCSTSVVVCFNGDAKVNLWGGLKKKVKCLNKSDILENGAKVVCIVRCKTKNGFDSAVKIGRALFSPYHPVKVNVKGEKKWVFPVDVDMPQKVEIDYWYNMVIDRENSPVVIGGVETVTLGHGMKNEVCVHPYYGTQKVVDALKKYDQFEKGFIEFNDPPVAKRDPITNLVTECF